MKKIKINNLFFIISSVFYVPCCSNFPNMEKVEKGPKEIFTPDIQKVRDRKPVLSCLIIFICL
jgi:hypothetical protein